MNKRAMFLAEETLKIVLAFIAIGFLVYFLVSLWMANQDSKDLELAKASLQHLVDEINARRTEVEIYNPEGWILCSWPHKVMKGISGFREEVEDRPNLCSNMGWEKCICICEDTLFLNLEGEDCDKMGICLESELIIKGDSINIKPVPLNLEIKNGEITKK